MSDLSAFALSLSLGDNLLPSHHLDHLVRDPLHLLIVHLAPLEVAEPPTLVVVEVVGELELLTGQFVDFLRVYEWVLLLLLQVEDGVIDAHERHSVSVGACIAVALTDEDELCVGLGVEHQCLNHRLQCLETVHLTFLLSLEAELELL